MKIDSAFGYKTAGAYNTQCCGLELLGLSKLSVGGDFGIDNFGVLYTFAAPANGRGASHAGWGGVGYGGGSNVDSGKPWTPTAAGAPYGNPKFPLTPGSAAGYPSGNHSGSYGGGQIYLEARRTVTVDGTVSMAGATKAGQYNERGAGSGGSICIKSARLAGSGALIADGGSNGTTPYNHGWSGGGGGGGGGGYICVLAEESPVQESFTGTMSAIGGNAYTEGELLSPTNRYSVWDHRGFDGKVYTHVRKGLMLFVR